MFFLGAGGMTNAEISINGEIVQYGDIAPTGPYVYLAKVTATFNITERKGYYSLTITEMPGAAVGGVGK